MDLTNHNPEYTFPILKSSDILLCLSELECETTQAEIAEPHRHKEKLRKIFLTLLENCSGVTEKDFEATQASKEKAASMSYPDLYEGRSEIKYFLAIRRTLRSCGVYDFSWRDLHSPTPKRLRLHLSAFINLAKYRDEQIVLYAEMNEPRTEFLISLDEVNKEHEELKEQLDQAEKKSEEDYSAIEVIEKECKSLTSEIARCNRGQREKRTEANALKKRANDLKDELATATWTLEEVEAEEERLRSQVVSSPDRRQNELLTKRDALDRERDECDELEEQVQSNRTMCKNVEEAVKAMQVENSLICDVKEKGEKYARAGQDYQQVSNEIDVTRKHISSVEEKVVLCERDLNRAEEKLANLHKQSNLKMQAAQASLESAKTRLLMVEKDRTDGLRRIEVGEAKVREIECAIEDERQQTQQEIDTMIAEYRETEELVITRLQERMAAFDN